MRKVTLIIALLVSTVFYSQTKGFAYQAVIYDSNVKSLPGVPQATVPLSKTNVCLQFSLLDATGAIEYKEQISALTDNFGIVNVIIGTGKQLGGYANSFGTINWNTTKMDLVVELDITGECVSFDEISRETLTTTPFSFNALTANNVSGIVSVANGGTGSDNVMGAKNNLGIGKIDNTSDLDKPISNATQIALNGKLDKTLTKAETITTSATNTLAISGLQNDTSGTNQLLSINPTTGVLSKVDAISAFVAHELVYTTVANDTQFTTPKSFTDIKKVNVYRNGIRIGSTMVDATHIKLEAGVVCNDNDEIRIVQYE